MSRIVVLGAAGMLGHKLCQRLTGHAVFGVVRRPASDYQRYREVYDGVTLIGEVDARDEDRLAATLRGLGPAVVVNCVGIVKQLPATDDVALCVQINALLPHRLARLCGELGARLSHVSTDCVFDGRRGGYTEADATDAHDLYGKSKALGETTDGEKTAVTLRTSFIGRELALRPHGLLEWFLAQGGERVDGFSRMIFSGVTSIELSKVIARIIERGSHLRGVHHVAGVAIGKHELLQLLRREYGLDIEIRRVDEPVCDRSLRPGAFLGALEHEIPDWPVMIREMRDDATPYDAWRAARGLS